MTDEANDDDLPREAAPPTKPGHPWGGALRWPLPDAVERVTDAVDDTPLPPSAAGQTWPPPSSSWPSPTSATDRPRPVLPPYPVPPGPPYDPRLQWAPPNPVAPGPPPGTLRARLALTAILLAAFAAIFWAKGATAFGTERTAVFYVGVPAVLAIAVVLLARPRRPVGMTLAATTVGLALAGPMLEEGVVCLIMAAPLIYGVAVAIAWAVSNKDQHPHRALATVPLLLILLVEGLGGISFAPREDSGSATAVVAASPEELVAAIAAEPEYAPYDSLLLSTVPFPVPVEATGTGVEVGDTRAIEFTPRRSLAIGAQPTARTMRLEVVESQIDDDGGRLLFDVTQDSTLARWLDLHSAEVTWHAIDGGTEVTWTLHYDRTFDPSWYFGPLQRYSTGLAADYLLDTFAVPAEKAATTARTATPVTAGQAG